jgi:rod shape-determining protein MreD
VTNVRPRPIIIPLTFVAALILEVLPLPHLAAAARPEWAAMVLIYWSMALPRRVGVGIGWVYGLVLDVLTGALLGQHALGFTLMAYLSIRLHQRLRVFPLWQQAISVALLLAPYLILAIWVDGMIGREPDSWAYWAPLLSSALFWPVVFVTLRALRRAAHLT